MLLGLPRKAGLFWLLIVSFAAAVLLVNIPAVVGDLSLWPAAVFFAVACGLAERVQVRLSSSRPGGETLCSVSCAVLVPVIVLFPLPWAALIAALGFALCGTLRGKVEPLKLLFNIANLTLSVTAGSAVLHLSGSPVNLASPLSIAWVALAALVYFLANTVLTAAIVALVLDEPIGFVWRRNHNHMLLADLALLAVGVPIAGLWQVYPWTLPCLVIGLLALHRAMADRVKLETQTLDSLFELADILDDRDKYTHGHSERVGYYAEQTAIQLGLSGDRAHVTFLAGRLHDIGKCAISNEVLRKPAQLDDDEQIHMRQHPAVGGAMLAHFSRFHEVANYVRSHHERWDGQGYPDGLRGEAIPFEARIIAVGDAYDAMTTSRPYRAALPHAEAIRRLRVGAGAQWDAHVVATFVKWADEHASREPLGQLIPSAAAD